MRSIRSHCSHDCYELHLARPEARVLVKVLSDAFLRGELDETDHQVIGTAISHLESMLPAPVGKT